MLFRSDYTVRARVTEGLVLASSAKLAVAENSANGRAFASGWSAPDATLGVSGITVSSGASTSNGVIAITYTAKAGGGTLNLVPTTGTPAALLTSDASGAGNVPAGGSISWSCNDSITGPTAGTLASKYRPAQCRP